MAEPHKHQDPHKSSEPVSLRKPPHSIEAEQHVIGALLLDRNALIQVGGRLHETDFYRREHALIYRAIQDLDNKAQPIDVVTVSEWLENHQLLDQCGGLTTIASLAENVPVVSNIEAHANIVRKRAVLRQLLQVISTIGETVYNPGGMEYSEILDQAETLVFSVAEEDTRIQHQYKQINELLTGALDHIGELSSAKNPITGLPTGFIDLDKKTAGLQSSDLIIIAGRPSMGKTALAINIAEHLCIHEQKSVAIFSLEMAAEQLAIRMLASLGNINQQHIRTGRLDDTDWTRLTSVTEMLANTRMFIDDTAGLTPEELRAHARRLKRDENIDLIIVDYLQLMQSKGPIENRTTEIAGISRALKNMAKELNIPVIVLSQLNRSVEQRPDKRPMMSDLRESGAIEQDADVILFIYRDEFYNRQSSSKGVAEVIISKQRNGPIGMVKLAFRDKYTRFENYTAIEVDSSPEQTYYASTQGSYP